MNALELTCPFCNARIPAEAAGAKVVCPRCGETFANRSAVQQTPASSGQTFQTQQPSWVAPPPKPTRRNFLVAGVVLGVMLCMAGAGLTYALLTKDVRRQHDKELPRVRRQNQQPEPKKQPLPPADPVAPASLAALGYLPPRAGLIAGVHVHEALTSKAAGELERRGFKVMNFELRLDMVKDLTGMAVEDVEHVVLGIDVVAVGGQEEKDLTPAIHVAVRTREKYDRQRLLEKLEAEKARHEKTPSGGKREVHAVSVKLGSLKLPASLWLADERTFVLGVFSKLEAVPEKPAEELAQLPKPLREAISQRLGVGTPMWLAGHAEDWSKTSLAALLGAFKDGPKVQDAFANVPMLGKIDRVQTFALGVVPDKPMKVQGAFRCPNEAAAKKLEAEELVPHSKKDETFKYSREGAWLSAQWTVDAGK